ncbi:MAG: inositol monophosphatase [Saprospiraceae bacterium]|nr:MAG: inositol monophosphatase [Saprospiraceae bacterium]
MDLEKLCRQALPIILKTGEFIHSEMPKVTREDIITKSLNSLVSYVDRTAEEQLVEGLGKLLPQATFLTEEETITTQHSDLQWIIDPLDGTTNFLHQLPVFSVSVALQHQNKTVLGFVYEVNRDECFYAWNGGGAFCNKKPIRVSPNSQLSDSLIATGFPYHDYGKMQAYLQVLAEFMRRTRGIRRFGSAAVDLAYVACGRFDGFFEYSLNAWDVAAGAFIVQEAGGLVTDFSGGTDYLFGGEIIASSPGIQAAFAELVAPLEK